MEPGQPHNANTTGQPQVPSPAAQAPRVAFFRPPQSQSRRGRRSNLALASVLLGLGSLSVVTLELVVPFLGVISWGMAVAGGSLGIVALKGIKRSGKRLRGVGSAIGGIAMSCGTLLLKVAMLLWLMQTVNTVLTTLSKVDMHNLNRAAISYADGHSGNLPDPARWKEELAVYLGGNPDVVLEHGFKPGSGRGFAMNESLVHSPLGANYNVLVEKAANSDRTVMFFEAKLGKPAGGSELLPEESAGKQGYVIGFLNGYVEAVPKDQLSDLIWIPQNK